MRISLILLLPMFLIAGLVNGQSLLKGIVFEDATNARMPNVFIRDNNNKHLTITDKKGNFSIQTETGHVLIFEAPGFNSDTLYLADFTQKRIILSNKSFTLREVSIKSSRIAFDPHVEYPQVYTKSKLYILSPSSWFGKESVDARRLKDYFKTEAEERHIDEVFNIAYVGSIVPLKGSDLENFMSLYRPSYNFIVSNSSPSLVAYINDSYKKFEGLPVTKRSLPKLNN